MQSLASERATVVLGVSKFVRLFVQVAILGLGAWLVIRHKLTGGAMIAGSIVMSRALAPVEQAIGTWKQALQARESCRRLRQFFARPLLCPADAMPLPAPSGRLSVENVVDGLAGQKQPILKGVSFAVEPGEAVAIVGPSAGGKSILARLLVGTRRPNSARSGSTAPTCSSGPHRRRPAHRVPAPGRRAVRRHSAGTTSPGCRARAPIPP